MQPWLLQPKAAHCGKTLKIMSRKILLTLLTLLLAICVGLSLILLPGMLLLISG
jgi:hypothetical protein